MRHLCISLFFLLFALYLKAQVPGDTLLVNSLNYSSTTRDTIVNFPNLPGVTYEKILMLYNMRCKNGLVSPGTAGQTNIGCGEWDYSCNTYITDSTQVDSSKAVHPSHTIAGYNGTTYNYTALPTYSYFLHQQKQVVYNATINETSGTIGIGNNTSAEALSTQLKNGKSQYLFTAPELISAGISAGNITSLKLFLTTAGSDAQFLKIKLKATTKTVLDNNAPDNTGFLEVYFLNTPTNIGTQQFNFYTPFLWNGIDNIIVEFSFTNTQSGTQNILAADATLNNSGLYTSENDYAFDFDGSNRIDFSNGGFNTINNDISISFWAKGSTTSLPANTSIFHGANAAGQRQLNLHMPWSDENIYWDCGNGSGYDRINKLATAAEYKGEWNHWTLTKNKTSGIMNIYLNGFLWHTGTGKTLPIALTNFNLGASSNGSNSYFGSVDDFSIWNKELSDSVIAAWNFKAVDATHPDYANLVASYPLNEGNGALSNDISTNISVGTISGNTNWWIHRGEDLFKNFKLTNLRPKMEFVQGLYSSTISTIVVKDSVKNNAQIVKTFSVNTTNDIITTSTNNYYLSGYTYIYDAITKAKVDSVLNTNQGTINITSLNYFKKSPAHFQIMSFVTPYGINLNLGMAGKTWTYDVTDFAPILKGNKRLFMNAGGEYQEQMDIKFLFIVGTPPRDVKAISNIWKVESVGFTNIINDNYFEPRTISLLNSATAFKVRTAITGHGQEGEFIPRTHSFNINGGAAEFNWDVWKACGSNPVFPQGGTWIYDRAGWCPGMSTDVKEMNITPFATPGSSVVLDYHLSTASGASNYWVSNQLVSYGASNFTLDAAVLDIINPSTKVEYAKTNSICKNPKITIQNTGSQALTSAKIDYWINGGSNKQTYEWTGNLAFLATVEIDLPGGTIWKDLNGPTNNYFYAEIKNPNNGIDAYGFNNKIKTPFNVTGVLPSNMIMQFRTNAFASESSYELKDGDGNIVFSRSNMNNNTTYNDTFNLQAGCYSFEIKDTDDDGISFWANNDGSGFARIRKLNNTIAYTFVPDFGKFIKYNFTVDYPLAYEDLEPKASMKVYPNPTQNNFAITLDGVENNQVDISNTLGQKVKPRFIEKSNEVIYFMDNLPLGVYFIQVKQDDKIFTQKLILE
jgi:Concanavalin A-like lectin/glucanases superfamily/Peptide-N-glycosidase F, C terminal/Secretion system C-terminal sorting domain